MPRQIVAIGLYGIALALAVPKAHAAPPPSRPPDPVLLWNVAMLEAIRAEDNAPTLATRNLAILHTAIYDAVNSVLGTHQPYRIRLASPPGTSPEAAALAAGYEVFAALYPNFAAHGESRSEAYRSQWPPTAEWTNGLALGREVARQALESRAADGATTTVSYLPSTRPGQWRRTPPFFRAPEDPQWRDLQPFCLPEIDPFVPPGPPRLDDPAYAAAFNEVKDIGAWNSHTRTAEQSQRALFWSDFSYTATPPGHWNEIAAAIAHGHSNRLEDNARLFALLTLAQADAAIVCWEAKFRYNTWRPITAIVRADEDGNPATATDPSWVSFLNTPSFPEYPSGHSTFSQASAVIISRFFATDALSFRVGSDALPGIYRTFSSLSACAAEIGLSRIHGGIHFQFSNQDGKVCGSKVGDHIAAHFLLPNVQLPRIVRDVWLAKPRPAFRVHGRAGSTCIVEVSSDLAHWLPLSTNQARAGGFPLADTEAPGTSFRFYRVRER